MNLDFSAGLRTADDSPLDALRNTIELENRFKTAFHGYDKKSVQEYIAQLSAVFNKALESVEAENERLKGENLELKLRAADQDKLIADARADERHKLEGAISIKESMLDSLRDANQRVTDENRELQLKITELNTCLAEARDKYFDNCASVAALNDELKGLLNAKFAECSGIITNWQAESVQLLKNRPSS